MKRQRPELFERTLRCRWRELSDRRFAVDVGPYRAEVLRGQHDSEGSISWAIYDGAEILALDELVTWRDLDALEAAEAALERLRPGILGPAAGG